MLLVSFGKPAPSSLNLCDRKANGPKIRWGSPGDGAAWRWSHFWFRKSMFSKGFLTPDVFASSSAGDAVGMELERCRCLHQGGRFGMGSLGQPDHWHQRSVPGAGRCSRPTGCRADTCPATCSPGKEVLAPGLAGALHRGATRVNVGVQGLREAPEAGSGAGRGWVPAGRPLPSPAPWGGPEPSQQKADTPRPCPGVPTFEGHRPALLWEAQGAQ